MKTLTSAAAACAMIVSSGSLSADTLLEDDFDSYTPGVLANSSNWPSAIPGSNPALSWQTNTGGPQAILDASVAGRTGQIYSYSENAANQTRTYSTVTLDSAYSGADDWELTLDFYIASMPEGQNSGTYTIATISNGDAVTADNQLVSVSVLRTQSSTNLNPYAAFGGTGVFFGEFLSTDTWYTLTVRGQHQTQTMSVTITGDSYDETRTGAYRNAHSQFDTIAIGDTTINGSASGRDNQIYLDALNLVAVPEPAVAFPLIIGCAGVAAFTRRGRD